MATEQMNVSMPPEMARYIRDRVKAGAYSNASEAVRDAIRHMQDADSDRELELTAAERQSIRKGIKQGVKDFEEGRYEEFDAEGLRKYFADIGERGRKRLGISNGE